MNRVKEKPNTRLEIKHLSRRVVLCCGEDEHTFISSLPVGFRGNCIEKHSFRSYTCYKYSDLSIILSGIGTGCLEPLLYELLSFDFVRYIILIGTAGAFPVSSAKLREVYSIDKAFLLGTGLDSFVRDLPLSPCWSEHDYLEKASIVSTDLYYGFGELESRGYRSNFIGLDNDISTYLKLADMVDMEVGQFYAICKFLSNATEIQYMAIKGPANYLSNREVQNINSQIVLLKAFQAAMSLLGL